MNVVLQAVILLILATVVAWAWLDLQAALATSSDASPKGSQVKGRTVLETAKDGTRTPAAVSLASLGAAAIEADGNLPTEQTAPK